MWDCETCCDCKTCMAQILAGQAFLHTNCNPPVINIAFTHKTTISQQIQDFIATHPRFITRDLWDLGLKDSIVLYHLTKAQKAGLLITSGSVWVTQPTNTGTQQVRYKVYERVS